MPFVLFVDGPRMADDKWIAGLDANAPISAAARLVLGVRLGVVRDRLPDAVFHADEDAEHVHQLRVATRRAGAALRIFAECLPARLYNKTRKGLRTLRRSAGAARDCDVFLADLRARSAKAHVKDRRGLDFLLGFAHGQRVLAQEQLRFAHAAKAEPFAEHVAAIALTLQEARPEKKTLNELAVPMLTDHLRELESAARADLLNYDALHQARILGKQVRYAMEIFAPCFAPEFRDRFYPAVVDMQDILGLANDSHVAAERLRSLRDRLTRTEPKHWRHCQEGIEMLLGLHERRVPQQRKKFERWWRAWLKSGAEQAFAELISPLSPPGERGRG